MEEKKKQNPYKKTKLIQTRVDNEDFQSITEKAQAHTDGDLSKYVRIATLNYRPKKVNGEK